MEEPTRAASWRLVKHTDDPSDIERILIVVRKRFAESADQRGFAVFSKAVFDYTKPSEAYRFVYFSPGASVDCKGALVSLRSERSDKPSDDGGEDEPHLKLEVGNSATAWDLLK